MSELDEIEDMETDFRVHDEATYKQRQHRQKLRALGIKKAHSKPLWKRQLSAHKAAATAKAHP